MPQSHIRSLRCTSTASSCSQHVRLLKDACVCCAGLYGGRKVLSRAFRSRFLELNVGDIPDGELATILEQRCALAPSYAAKLVAVMRVLYRQRQVGFLQCLQERLLVSGEQAERASG